MKEQERQKREDARKRQYAETNRELAESVIDVLRETYREQTGGSDIGKKTRVVLEGMLTVRMPHRDTSMNWDLFLSPIIRTMIPSLRSSKPCKQLVVVAFAPRRRRSRIFRRRTRTSSSAFVSSSLA